MFRFGQEEPEPEPEPEPINWSANLIIAAKGGSVVIPEIWDEWDTLVQEEEELAGLELAKRCRLEGADLAYTGAEPSSDDSIDVAEAETARTALDWASAFKNIEVMEYLQLEDATERLIDACRTQRTGDVPSETSILARATQARMDGADLLAEGEYIKGHENWCPVIELCVFLTKDQPTRQLVTLQCHVFVQCAALEQLSSRGVHRTTIQGSGFGVDRSC